MTTTTHRYTGLLDGKVAVITGAGTGIGKVIAQTFVREGARVLVADITGAEQQTASELGPTAVAFNCDVRREDQVEAMISHALEAFGKLDVLANVAGNPGGRRAPEVSQEEYEQITGVHLLGTLLCNKHAIRAMLRNGGGSIVNISSVASLNADNRLSPVYSAAKAGINSATKAFAVQYGPQNIRVNAIACGFTLSQKNMAAPPHVMSELSAKAALKRAGRPEEQAEVAAFLASDRASFVSGVIIPVDGGWTARLA